MQYGILCLYNNFEYKGTMINMMNKNFAIKHYMMHETHNNCLRQTKQNKTLLQAKNK